MNVWRSTYPRFYIECGNVKHPQRAIGQVIILRPLMEQSFRVLRGTHLIQDPPTSLNLDVVKTLVKSKKEFTFISSFIFSLGKDAEDERSS